MSRSASRYHHGNLPEALERAAMALLETQPAHDISLREVAREAGVSHNAPYHHFGDRKALLKVLAERSMAALVASQRAAAGVGDDGASGAGVRDAGAALRSIAKDYVRFASERPHVFSVIYDPAVCVPGHPTETMAPLIAAEESLLADVVQAAMPGVSEPELRLMGAAMWGSVHGLAQLSQAGHLPLEAALAAVDVLLDRVLPAA